MGPERLRQSCRQVPLRGESDSMALSCLPAVSDALPDPIPVGVAGGLRVRDPDVVVVLPMSHRQNQLLQNHRHLLWENCELAGQHCICRLVAEFPLTLCRRNPNRHHSSESARSSFRRYQHMCHIRCFHRKPVLNSFDNRRSKRHIPCCSSCGRSRHSDSRN